MKKPLTVVFYQNGQGQWYWKLKSPNGKSIAIGGEGYNRVGGAILSFNRVGELAANAKRFIEQDDLRVPFSAL